MTDLSDVSGSVLRAGAYFTESSEDDVRKVLSVVRAGKSLQPRNWPNGAQVAVAITFDVDHEFPVYQPNPAFLSVGQYGATTALPRIFKLLKKHQIPATFFVPGMVQLMYPETVPGILQAGPHEVGLHGWVHERAPELRDRAEEAHMIDRAIQVITDAAGGKRPVGYRAPSVAVSDHTLELLDERGIVYDSSLSARDEPYELLFHGAAANLIEIPFAFELSDYTFLHNDECWRGSLASPDMILDVYKSDFDVAYSERTIFNLTLHPQVIGRRSRSVILDKLLNYIKSKENVWFATLGEIAGYVKASS
jgi:peptidoglycan-N-acetylglucosamine deacetylase